MKKSDVLKQERAALHTKMTPLVEKEDLTTEERNELDGYHDQDEQYKKDIATAERNEKFLLNQAGPSGQSLSGKEERELSSFSFAKVFRHAEKGNTPATLDGLEGEMHQEAVSERQSAGVSGAISGFGIPQMVLHRANTGQNVGTAADGGNLVSQEPVMFFEALQKKMVLSELGARFIPGLVGDLPIARGGSFTAGWVGEGTKKSATKESFGKDTMSPKMLICVGATSKMLMAQTNNVVDSILKADLLSALAIGIQEGALVGATNGPGGLLNETGINPVVMGDNGLALDWANVVKFETALADANVDTSALKWLINSKLRGKLKTTPKSATLAHGYLMTDKEINGYQAAVSNSMPSTLTKGTSDGVCSAAVLGDWSQLLIGQWGGLDIIVDNITLADQGEVKYTVNTFADSACGNPAAFAVSKDILT